MTDKECLVMLSIKNILNYLWPILGEKEREAVTDFQILCRKCCGWGDPAKESEIKDEL